MEQTLKHTYIDSCKEIVDGSLNARFSALNLHDKRHRYGKNDNFEEA